MTLGPGDDDDGELSAVEVRLVALLAEALALGLRGEVHLLEEDAGLPTDRDDEDSE